MIYAKWVSQSLKNRNEESKKRLKQMIVDHFDFPEEEAKASIEQRIYLLDKILSSDQMGSAWHSLVQACKQKFKKINRNQLNNQASEAESEAYLHIEETIEFLLTDKLKTIEHVDKYLKIPRARRSELSKKMLAACQDIREAVDQLGISAGFESLVSNADFSSVGLDKNTNEDEALERLDLHRIVDRCAVQYYEWNYWLDFDENKDYKTLASLEHGQAYKTLGKDDWNEYVDATRMLLKPPSLKVEALNQMLQQIEPDIELLQTMISRIESGLITRFLNYLEHQARKTTELPDLTPRPNNKTNERNLFAFRFSGYLKNRFGSRLWSVVAAVTNIIFDSSLDAKDVERQVSIMEKRIGE